MLFHATTVALNKKAVLIAGPSGSGKSDLALRLIDSGAELVADDQTEIILEEGGLVAQAPPTIAGMIEVRHVGLLRMPFLARAYVALYVELSDENQNLERLPEVPPFLLLDYPIRRLSLPAFFASTPAKIKAALIHSRADG